jgi:broad specificity phosphatase PhoE
VIAGTLTRQIETARAALAEPEIDPRFAEFDLDMVYRGIAPVLSARDERFRAEFEAMRRAMEAADAPVHREWNRCDIQVFQAWFSAEIPVEGETWLEFRSRVHSVFDWLRQIRSGEHVAVFTSATPIGLILAALFGADDARAMHLAGACYNASITTLRVRDGDIRLMHYNSIGHLDDPALRTFR